MNQSWWMGKSERMNRGIGSSFRLTIGMASAVLLGACGAGQGTSDPVQAAEAFVDAFYAWDSAALSALIEPGEDRDRVLYYQGWAEAANYQVQSRRFCELVVPEEGGSGEAIAVRCAITVTDDFGQALGYTATDTFSLSIANGQIVAASFAGDDPPIFEAVFAWMAEDRPEVFVGPCRDMFEGGETPADCARAVAQAARDYVEANL